MKSQPPKLLIGTISLWAVLWIALLVWNAVYVGLLESVSILMSFDDALMSSISVSSTLTVAAMTVLGLVAVPLVWIKMHKGSLETKSTFMSLNFVQIASIVWGAFHLSSFMYLALALVPVGILVTMVASDEIGQFFAEQNNLSKSLK